MRFPKQGCRPTRIDHRDYDFLKSKKLGAVLPAFAENYSVDRGLRVPDQETPDNNFNPMVPSMPYGCTNYASCEICTDEDGILYNPSWLESITHANENKGADVRTVLKAVIQKGVEDQQGTLHYGHPAFFNIQSSGAIDSFDAARLAMLSASAEHRSVSVGSPYWGEWGGVQADGILPAPQYNLQYCSWHNYVLKGWKTINGVTYLICQMLQGDTYGDHGFAYMSREMCNATMAINGSVMFTLDKLMPNEVQTVDVSIIDWIVSYVRSLFRI